MSRVHPLSILQVVPLIFWCPFKDFQVHWFIGSLSNIESRLSRKTCEIVFIVRFFADVFCAKQFQVFWLQKYTGGSKSGRYSKYAFVFFVLENASKVWIQRAGLCGSTFYRTLASSVVKRILREV